MWRNRRSTGFHLFSLLGGLFLCLCSSIAWGQSTAQINGTVTDQSGAVLPGVEVTATQTETGLTRSVVSNETGSYVLPNLPVGPYRLEAGLPGFRKFAQTGIVLQVGGNPVINISLAVGQVADTVEVQADAALVETRATGVGQVIDNVRVLELPLNGRQVTELIILSGAAVGGGTQGTNRTWPTDVISVGGGLNNGLSYILDGGTHNDPYGNLNLPLPFPDALQEFKVETSAVPAQYGQHSAGAMNAVTKSGTNDLHGSLFEFVRNKVFNARNAFAEQRDGLKRNQFGGVLGGPIVRNKLFFFAGHQMTLQRSVPVENTAFVPTAQMLAGDWTTVASPACNQGRQITLRAPFQNNRIDPAQFTTPALNLIKRSPTSSDPCGKALFGRKSNSDDTMTLGRIDYQRSDKHSLFGRYELARLDAPSDYDGKTWFSLGQGDYIRRAHSFVLGDTYSISPNMVSSFRGTLLRTTNEKTVKADLFNFSDLGVKGLWYPSNYPKIITIQVQGAFSSGPGGAAMHTPGVTNSTVYQFAEDLSLIHGAHQIGFGANFIHSNMNYTASTATPGMFVFNSTNTGLSLGDFMTGKPNSWTQSQISAQYKRQHYIGMYIQDTWKATSKLTLNAGVRWEPFLFPYDARAKTARFQKDSFDKGLRSTVFKNAPAGVLFSGDPGVPDTGYSESSARWLHFAPRLGLAFDPKGDGLTVVRAAYGIFFDYPHFNNFAGLRNTPPRNVNVSIPQPVGGFEDPWQGYPGGNPLPVTIDQNFIFPLASVYTIVPVDLKTAYVNAWNLSVQKQVGSDWLLSGNYVGNSVVHQLNGAQINPAIYLPGASCVIAGRTFSPCSTTGNTNQRRVLYLQDPVQGQYYSSVGIINDGGTRSYNAMVLSVQRRRVKGVTVQGNYTWSHCIDDGYTDTIQQGGTALPERRGLYRSNCELDRRHNMNMSAVYETPQFANSTLRVLGTGWRVSGIVRILSGAQLAVATGLGSLGIAPDATDEVARQILPSPYAEKKTINQWLNPAAFITPVLGAYGPLIHAANVTGPGSIRVDIGLTRTFRLREKQSLEFRAEAFNAPNHVNPLNPVTSLSDPSFGRILSAADPRIMQMALKFVF